MDREFEDSREAFDYDEYLAWVDAMESRCEDE